MTDTSIPPATGPLKDLRVIEMGSLIAGPFCGQLMGDMGADVIKIEAPGEGDPMRKWGQGARPAWWRVIARNKRSIALDLRQKAGQEIARQLIAKADILIENFRPGTIEKWGLAPEALHADNPGLIVVRVSGYGQDGPYADRAGFGLVGEAMGGWRYLVGEPDRPPARMGVSIGDTLAATYGCMGALAALHHREKTGRGQVVDSALYESVLQVMESLLADYGASGHMRERSGAILPRIAPSNAYPCSDGYIVIGANQDNLFKRFAETIGKPEWAANPRYQTHLARAEVQAELDEMISQWTRQHTVAEIDAMMVKAGVPAGPINRPDQILADPHIAARNAIHWEDHPTLGRIPMQNAFPKFSETPGRVRRPAPDEVGQHTAEVLAETLGMTEARLIELRKSGVIAP
ncbi:MAG TPA: CoA transferase [Hyphomonadaceae bacterium]|nr:CoA transferase [Hyphomonadaceae bacterium]